MPTFSASQNGSENIYLARRNRTCVAFQKRLHTVKLLLADDCRAEMVIEPAAPVIHPSIQLFFQHTPESGVTPVHAVGFPDIADSSTLGNRSFKVVESVLHNGCVFWHNFQPLFLINTEAKGSRAGNNGAVGNLTVKYNVYSFPVNVRFILGNGQLHVNIQTPVCGCGVIFFISGFPAAVVRFQNFHDFIIICHGTKPAVKAAEKQNIHFITLHTVHHALKVGSFMNVLSGGLGSVNVNSNNDPATFPCVCFQSFLLGFQ